MGKVKDFTIVLQKAIPIYSSGEIVEGVVKFKMTERRRIHSLKCTITGLSDFIGRFSIFQNSTKYGFNLKQIQ